MDCYPGNSRTRHTCEGDERVPPLWGSAKQPIYSMGGNWPAGGGGREMYIDMSRTILQRSGRLDCNQDVEIARRDYSGLELRGQGSQSYDCDGSSTPVEGKKLIAFGFPLALA